MHQVMSQSAVFREAVRNRIMFRVGVRVTGIFSQAIL